MSDTSNSPKSSLDQNQGKNSKKTCNKQQVDSTTPAKSSTDLFRNSISGSKSSEPRPFCRPKSVDEGVPQKRTSLDTYRITSELSRGEDEIEFNRAAEFDQKKLKRRARKKFFGRVKAAKLAHLYSPLEEKYWETYRCSDMIVRENGKVRAHFCKHRHCEVCNNIRTAHYIEKYMPTLETWKDKVFMTLTVKNPNRENLQETLNKMHEHFTKIKDSERKAGRKLIGLRKLEITYNRREKTFHPHFHLVLRDGASAEHIILKWLKKFNPDVDFKLLKEIRRLLLQKIDEGANLKKFIALGEPYDSVRKGLSADPQFQDWRPADQNACMELFKYVTKLTSSSKNDKVIDTVALDKIYQSIRGRRIFQTFGFVAHEEVPAPENEEIAEDEIQEPATFEWLQEHHDWVNRETGEFLSGYVPTAWDLDKPKYLR